MDFWKEIIDDLTAEFTDWGCPFSAEQLPEIAMTYECTPLFFWNWLDGEAARTEKGFLRVLGYAWKKLGETMPDSRNALSLIGPVTENPAAA